VPVSSHCLKDSIAPQPLARRSQRAPSCRPRVFVVAQHQRRVTDAVHDLPVLGGPVLGEPWRSLPKTATY
jgi:hypothetical protein